MQGRIDLLSECTSSVQTRGYAKISADEGRQKLWNGKAAFCTAAKIFQLLISAAQQLLDFLFDEHMAIGHRSGARKTFLFDQNQPRSCNKGHRATVNHVRILSDFNSLPCGNRQNGTLGIGDEVEEKWLCAVLDSNCGVVAPRLGQKSTSEAKHSSIVLSSLTPMYAPILAGIQV